MKATIDKPIHLSALLEASLWDEATERVQIYPEEAARADVDPSCLALACRLGAPLKCLEAILHAAPSKLRHVLDSRGSPLHEAIVCERMGANEIAALLRADDALEEEQGSDTATATPSNRVALSQDVDGFTPLHLLIRRRFQSNILQSDSGDLLPILDMLVRSCPEAVIIPDRGEYEEPPIVYAIKANIYAPSLGAEDDFLVERQIYEMVACMLRYCPQAASCVFTGYRGQYTALHSAVFHGRHTNTIGLLLDTERAQATSPATKAALLSNTQGENPLHFCAMRGERPRSVAIIAKAAPEAVLKRDASGLTPLHWLWVRFVSSLLVIDVRGADTTAEIALPSNEYNGQMLSRYDAFTALEQGDFDSDLQLIKRMDPPVDFLRMRHIPLEVLGDLESLQWAKRSVEVLRIIRARYDSRQGMVNYGEEPPATTIWNRREVVVSLFWTKVVSMLQAATMGRRNAPIGESTLVHIAFATPSCLAAIVYIVASMFPEELDVVDNRGRLPVHYAASRVWHAWDWPRDDNVGEPHAARILLRESLGVLRTALDLSRPETARVADNGGRLVIHHVVDTFARACSRPARSTKESLLQGMLELLQRLVHLNPESLQRRDGVSKLYPFLQATAVATECKRNSHVQDELPLSLTFELLRQNPALLGSG